MRRCSVRDCNCVCASNCVCICVCICVSVFVCCMNSKLGNPPPTWFSNLFPSAKILSRKPIQKSQAENPKNPKQKTRPNISRQSLLMGQKMQTLENSSNGTSWRMLRKLQEPPNFTGNKKLKIQLKLKYQLKHTWIESKIQNQNLTNTNRNVEKACCDAMPSLVSSEHLECKKDENFNKKTIQINVKGTNETHTRIQV